jgi:hypothetical protein
MDAGEILKDCASNLLGGRHHERGDRTIGLNPGRRQSVDLRRPRQEGQYADVGVSMPSSRHRVLVVDDEPQVAAMLTDALTTLGYAVRWHAPAPTRLIPSRSSGPMLCC